MSYNICNECETVAHCLKHGCVPMVPHYSNTNNPVDFPNVVAGAEINGGDGGYSEGTASGYAASVRARSKSRIHSASRVSGLDVYGLGLDREKWEAALDRYTEIIVRECANVGLETHGNYDVHDDILKHLGFEA